MKTKEILTNNNSKEFATVSQKTVEKQPIILLDEFEKDKSEKFIELKGKLTSQIWTRKSTDTPYYAFLRRDENQKHSRKTCERTKCRDCEIPVVFRLNSPTKPILDKNNSVILQGQWASSQQSHRPSFTCYSYKILSHEQSPWAFNKDHE